MQLNHIKYADYPTGITNTDTTALQTLINSFGGEEGEIKFRPGTYTLGQISLPSNISLYNGKVIAKSALNNDLFRNSSPLNGNSNINFYNMEIDGNASQQTDLSNPCHAIGFYNCQNCIVNSCNIYNVEMDGVYIGRNGTVHGESVGGPNSYITIKNTRFTDIRRNGISVTRGEKILIDKCRFINNNLGYRLGNAGYNAGAVDLEGNAGTDIVEYIIISNSYFENYASASIQISSGHTPTKHVAITNNEIRQNTRFGIVIFSHSEDIEVAHNKLYIVDAHGIWSNAFAEEDLTTGLHVHHNEVRGDDTGLYGGISYNYSSGIVEDNLIRNFNRGLGMYFYTTASLLNNTITSCTNSIVTGGAGVSLVQEGNVVN